MSTPTIHIHNLCKTYIVSEREKAFLRQITLVMGQRDQLVWDIPAIDSYELKGGLTCS